MESTNVRQCVLDCHCWQQAKKHFGFFCLILALVTYSGFDCNAQTRVIPTTQLNKPPRAITLKLPRKAVTLQLKAAPIGKKGRKVLLHFFKVGQRQYLNLIERRSSKRGYERIRQFRLRGAAPVMSLAWLDSENKYPIILLGDGKDLLKTQTLLIFSKGIYSSPFRRDYYEDPAKAARTMSLAEPDSQGLMTVVEEPVEQELNKPCQRLYCWREQTLIAGIESCYPAATQDYYIPVQTLGALPDALKSSFPENSETTLIAAAPVGEDSNKVIFHLFTSVDSDGIRINQFDIFEDQGCEEYQHLRRIEVKCAATEITVAWLNVQEKVSPVVLLMHGNYCVLKEVLAIFPGGIQVPPITQFYDGLLGTRTYGGIAIAEPDANQYVTLHEGVVSPLLNKRSEYLWHWNEAGAFVRGPLIAETPLITTPRP